ncbi:MAG: M48 family metalloprotease [Candidatus Atabeyarchaeum deiterrae]
MAKKYFSGGFRLRMFTILLLGFFIAIGLAYMMLYVPMFYDSDFFQITSVTWVIAAAFLLSAVIVSPLEYRLDKKYDRTTLGFRGYFSYKLRSRIVFLVPFAVLLLLSTSFWLLEPGGDIFSTPLTFLIMALAILIVGIIMPRIYGSILKKERIEDVELTVTINNLEDRMGIKGKAGGAYHVPVRGFKAINAAQLGFAQRQRRIYLIGEIDKVLNKDEVEAVIAHELAHMKYHHILKLMLIIVALMAGVYLLLSVLGIAFLEFLLISGFVIPDEVILLALIVVEYMVPFTVVYLILLKIRRMFELEADLLAARSTSPQHLSAALLKLAEYNLIPMKFSRFTGAIMSHPSISERVERLTKLK